ncbi:hypothetical protein Sviol_54980 [Streptomyces violascens]|uniref:Uncharacterized protein n=1 Tax=Streptomyces violascens TaxID=67381 RepID=A0ABQ3QUZ4_9ACTN|nr:hypothetical protein Sviol_54980 [Streptomyces violascens]
MLGHSKRSGGGEGQKATYLSRVREVYQLGRREGLSLQRQKLKQGAAPSLSSPTKDECAERLSGLGQQEKTVGDQASFVSACSEFPTPGTPGYEQAVAEANGTSATP